MEGVVTCLSPATPASEWLDSAGRVDDSLADEASIMSNSTELVLDGRLKLYEVNELL